jgi:hypothetical protein
MTRFYEPDLTANPDSPFVRDASNKLVPAYLLDRYAGCELGDGHDERDWRKSD